MAATLDAQWQTLLQETQMLAGEVRTDAPVRNYSRGSFAKT